MADMKKLTINGTTYDVVDDGALHVSGGTMEGELGIKQGGVGIQLGTSGNICATDTHSGGGTTRTILGAGVHWATDGSVEDEMTVGHPAFHLALRGSKKRPSYCEKSSKANNTELALIDDVPTKTSQLTNDSGYVASGHTHSANDIAKAGYLTTHPELATTTTIPFIYNDLAFLTLKGGSVTAYTTTSTDLTAETLEQGELNLSGGDKLFNGTPACAYLMTDGNYVAVLDLVLHKTFQYNNNFYIDFGLAQFRAKNISVYVMNKDTETSYTLKNSITNNEASYIFCTIAHTSKDTAGKTVYGFNRLRIVLSGFNQSGSSYGRRLAEIGLVNYSSGGLTETFISRGGCDGIYGNLRPQTDNTAYLGGSAKRWLAVFASNFNGALKGNADTATALSKTCAIEKGGTGATTAEGARENLGVAEKNHSHDYLPLTGGAITGAIDASGTTNVLDFGTSGYFRGLTGSGNRFDFFALVGSTRFVVGGSYPALEFKGKNTRPTYNGSDMALLSDVMVANPPLIVTGNLPTTNEVFSGVANAYIESTDGYNNGMNLSHTVEEMIEAFQAGREVKIRLKAVYPGMDNFGGWCFRNAELVVCDAEVVAAGLYTFYANGMGYTASTHEATPLFIECSLNAHPKIFVRTKA